MEIKEMLRLAYMRRDEIVLCLLGSPGIGKTQSVYEFAEEKGVKVVEIIASQILPNEVSGITMPVDKTHSMEVYDHARLASLENGDILFFDELLQANAQTLSACLTLIQERRMMSGRKLPDVMIVAAANEDCQPNRLPESIRQRFMFVKVPFDRQSFNRYIRRKYGFYLPAKVLEELAMNADVKKNEWNVLTPRSLEKTIEWYKSVPKEDREKVADMAISIYNMNLGDVFLSVDDPAMEYRRCKKGTIGSVRAAVFDALKDKDMGTAVEFLDETKSLEEIMSDLQRLPGWEGIMSMLKDIEIDEEETDDSQA